MKYFNLLLFFLLTITKQYAQQHPPDMRWKRIKTPHFEVVFSEAISAEGQRAANTLEYIFNPVCKTLETRTKPISVFLFNRSVYPQGYVSIGPRYSAWFMTPMQNTTLFCADDWMQSLAIHEFRHVVQYAKSNQYFTKFGRIFYGEAALAGLTWSEPLWYSEGDAVTTETVLTNGGRGRNPAFTMATRCRLLSGSPFSYYKAYMGSYKDFVPDYYELGYLMSIHTRQKYGANIWSRVITNSSKYSFYPFAFSRSLKKFTTNNNKEMYLETISAFDSIWRKQNNENLFSEAKYLNKAEKKTMYRNYFSPQTTAGGNCMALVSGMDIQNRLVSIAPDGEEKILTKIPAQQHFSTRGDKIVWLEKYTHPRWTQVSYSDIVVYSIEQERKKRITHHGKYFAPSLSLCGKKIVAVEFLSNQQCSLVVLDAETGNVLKKIPSPDNEFIRKPSWSADGTQVVFAHSGIDGQSLSIVNIETGDIYPLVENEWESFGDPVFYHHYVMYDSPYSGIGNIYAINIKTKERYQITNRKHGAYNPHVSSDNKKLLFQDYDISGYNVAEIAIDSMNWVPLKKIKKQNPPFIDNIVRQEQNGSIMFDSLIPDKKYEVEKYPLLSNLINIHSWGLVPTMDNNLQLNIYSKNKLNTMEVTGGLEYNTSEKTLRKYVNATYSGFFPVFSTEISFGKRKGCYANAPGESYTWKENRYQIGFHIPLVLSRGLHYSYFQTGASFHSLVNDYENVLDRYDQTVNSLSYHAYFYRYRKSATRDIFPRWGTVSYLNFHHTPAQSDSEWQFSAYTNIYFPSLFKHHGFRLQLAFEKQEEDEYSFSSAVQFSRGYEYEAHKEFYKASLDYSFPFLYPDLALGSLLYIKRIRANVFYDYGVAYSVNHKTHFESTGIDVLFDFHPLSLPYELSFGIKGTYRLQDQQMWYGIVLMGIDF